MPAFAVLEVVAGTLLLVAVVVALAMVPVVRRSKRARREMEAELGRDARRSEAVRTLGLLSRGKGQVRGTGRLVLTSEALHFRQMVPDRTTVIPLVTVVSVASERTWLGKWVGKRLLCVRWRAPDGAEDAMAWEVRDLDAWIATIDAQRVDAVP